jgi:hypothetical protein
MEDVQKKEEPQQIPHAVKQVMQDTGMCQRTATEHMKQRNILVRRIKSDNTNKYLKG